MNANQKQPCPWVVNTTAATFEQDIMERSKEVPVVVDFWAAWCNPCRVLGPTLEKLARAYSGRFVLVKADMDRLPDAAIQFRVESIPAVFGVVGGEVVDFFAGALPESHVRAWLDRLLLAALLLEAQRCEASDPARAERNYHEILAQQSDNRSALIGLGRLLEQHGRVDEAKAILRQLESRGFLEPEAEKLRAALELRDKGNVDVTSLRQAADANPGNLELQLQLAQGLAGSGTYQEALDICLTLVERDRPGVGERARQAMIDIFRVLPEGSSLVNEYRRKLAMLLY
jgi:putative thioredoxin